MKELTDATRAKADMLLALSPLLGLSVVLIFVMNPSFHGVATEHVKWIAAVAGLTTTVSLMYHSVHRLRDLIPIGVIFSIVVVHFLWPILSSDRSIILVDAGDFNQYIGVGSSLVLHPISEPAHMGLSWNTIQANVDNHQAAHLRLGISMLLSFFAALLSKGPAEIYSYMVSLFVGLQAISVYCLMLAGFRTLPRYLLVTASVLYGLSATVTWPAYAAFIPQTLGLAFAVGVTALWVLLVRDNCLARPLSDNWRTFVAMGVLAFGLWAVYPESFLLVVLIALLYAGLHYRSALWQKNQLLNIGKFLILTFLIWFVASPDCFIWGVRGLYVQLGSIPHGGEQVSSAYNLLATSMLSTQLPLVAGILESVPIGYKLLGVVSCTILVVGFAFLFTTVEMRSLVTAVAAAGLLLIGFVLYKYSYRNYGYYPLWASLYTWNLFKAAQYVSPFVAALSFGGVFSLLQKFSVVSSRVLVAMVVFMGLALMYGQDRQVWSRAYTEKMDGELISYLNGLPREGRLLIHLSNKSYYARYVLYSFLSERPYLSVNDWQPDELYRQEEMAPAGNGIFSEQIFYVLADDSFAGDGFPVVARHENLRLLSVPPASSFRFKVVGIGRPEINLESGPFGIRPVH